jgi:transcription elongation factor GreB
LSENTKNYITPSGAQKLKTELHFLLNEERPNLVRTVQWAASNGDRSENADYIYGKRRLREIDRRIRFLQKRLEAAFIVDPSTQMSDRILFGATVKIQDENLAEKKFTIVGEDEIDVKLGRISWKSPMARAMMNSKQGDVVTVKTPQGEMEIEILEIKYEKS